MSRLLRASFARLKKDKTFWICLAVMFGIGALFVISNYVTMKFRGYGAIVDDALFSYGTYIGMFLAAFSSLYIGKEFHRPGADCEGDQRRGTGTRLQKMYPADSL